jgi:hypothetical protein
MPTEICLLAGNELASAGLSTLGAAAALSFVWMAPLLPWITVRAARGASSGPHPAFVFQASPKSANIYSSSESSGESQIIIVSVPIHHGPSHVIG